MAIQSVLTYKDVKDELSIKVFTPPTKKIEIVFLKHEKIK
jgi:hypothetical protein